MIQAILMAIMVSLVAGSEVEKPNFDNLLERKYPALTFERFEEIVHNVDDITDLKATPLNVTIDVKLERFEKARAEIEEIRRNKNLTFDVDFMPFNAWSDDQQKMLHGFVQPDNETMHNLTGAPVDAGPVGPAYAYKAVNYVDQGVVTSIKNQGMCGSCYAFAATAQVESALLIAKIKTGDLSVQQMVECTFHRYHYEGFLLNLGCRGGQPFLVVGYFAKYDVLPASQLPYNIQALQYPRCSVHEKPQKHRLNYKSVRVTDENHLAYMLDKNGPISILIHSSSPSFKFYKGGIFNDVYTCRGMPDHAVLLVGLVQKNGREAWLIKNSWGTRWGDKGYMLLAKGQNVCNIITIPVVLATINKEPIVD